MVKIMVKIMAKIIVKIIGENHDEDHDDNHCVDHGDDHETVVRCVKEAEAHAEDGDKDKKHGEGARLLIKLSTAVISKFPKFCCWVEILEIGELHRGYVGHPLLTI